jgi:hypothetical protein
MFTMLRQNGLNRDWWGYHMDTLRGHFSGHDAEDGLDDYALGDEEPPRQVPPSIIGQDERRMQVRAYNFWASLLDNRNFPSIEDLDPEVLTDFGPYSVLLDFTCGIDNPAIQYLGDMLAEECGAVQSIQTLSDVPSRSLLSRITDHYMQILANQAPIGFEAEFVNQRGVTIAYRGILLPFSSNGDSIDFIYGVINWKELADQKTADELLLEIDQALEPRPGRDDTPMPEWADGPADPNDVLDLVTPMDGTPGDLDWPEPSFGNEGLDRLEELAEVAANDIGAAAEHLGDIAPEDMELADWLASARELAQAAKGSEDRSRQALYAAIGRAYDFSIAAADEPEDFDELVADAGLTTQDRAPMTPVVKLVFGAEYDKTRLTEYASALGHAQRIGLGRGELADYLSSAPGGLKGVVNAERRLRREESGKPVDLRETPRETLARKLRQLDHQPLSAVAAEGNEFTLLVARRLPTGEVVLLGEVSDDVPLLERAARKLLA